MQSGTVRADPTWIGIGRVSRSGRWRSGAGVHRRAVRQALVSAVPPSKRTAYPWPRARRGWRRHRRTLAPMGCSSGRRTASPSSWAPDAEARIAGVRQEFVAILREHEHHLPIKEGQSGSVLLHLVGRGQRRQRRPPGVGGPVPTDQAEQLAAEVPVLVLRDEPAHREAFIHLVPGGQTEPARWQLTRSRWTIGANGTRRSRLSWAPGSHTS